LFTPTANLALDVTVGMAELREPDRLVVDRVDRDENVDQLFGLSPRVFGGERRELGRRAQDRAVDLLHHVEGRVVDRLVGAERERARNRHVGTGERGEHGVLAGHVVRGR